MTARLRAAPGLRARLPGALLAFTGITGLMLAAAALVFPRETAASLGFEADTQGMIEIRATFAGFFAGCSAFLLAAWRDPALRRAGLLFLALGAGGAAAARLVGFVAEGSMPPALILVLAYEIAVAGLAVFALRDRPLP